MAVRRHSEGKPASSTPPAPALGKSASGAGAGRPARLVGWGWLTSKILQFKFQPNNCLSQSLGSSPKPPGDSTAQK